MTERANIIGGREIQQIRQENPLTANVLRRIISAITQTATSAGVSPVGRASAPPTIGAINVKASNGLVHATIQDSSANDTSTEWFIEHDTNPNFTAPYVKHLVSSRDLWVNLPQNADDGHMQLWYFRGYSQKPGSPPSAPVYFGGLSPTGVNVGGGVNLTPLSSTGSGTASPTGQQGGWGRGKVPTRPPQGPKRNVS